MVIIDHGNEGGELCYVVCNDKSSETFRRMVATMDRHDIVILYLEDRTTLDYIHDRSLVKDMTYKAYPKLDMVPNA